MGMTKDYIDSLYGDGKCVELQGKCHDCGAEVSVVCWKDGDVEGGAFWYIPEQKQMHFFKCEACFGKDPVLRNYREAEVWSRVCGYLRPVKQWNRGKQQEFSDRVNFVPR